jgi:hypothetical protein
MACTARQTCNLIGHMLTAHDIDRLRANAAHYRHKAAQAKRRDHLIYCRALAAHLAREATELELIMRSNVSRESDKMNAD